MGFARFLVTIQKRGIIDFEQDAPAPRGYPGQRGRHVALV